MDAKPRPATILQHLAEGEKLLGAVAPPIFQTSTFAFEDHAALAAAFGGSMFEPPYVYSRVSNPTADIVERKLAALEGCEACRLGSSGMAAIAWAIMSSVQQGSHVVAIDTLYGPTKQLLDTYLTKFGVSVTYVDGIAPSSVLDALRPETTLVFLESPSTAVFRLQNLGAICAETRQRGITTAIDNTYATPLYQNPHALGVDLVCHTASKYFGGHSDLIGGALCGNKERMERIVHNEVALFGSMIMPLGAWLMLRGLRTLEIRIKRHEETANRVAAWLETRPEVEQVHHVSLESFPQRDLYLRQMRGSTGLFSFTPKCQSKSAINAFTRALRFFTVAVSWGGHESLVMPMTVPGSGETVIRLYCGLEDPQDLLDDLASALPILSA